MTVWDEKSLRAFETRVAESFNRAEIKAPVHLSFGNEKPLLEIFSKIAREDFVFSTWRSHYHALLHGVDEQRVMNSISEGHSISMSFPENRFFSSAIVAGLLPEAVGVAESLMLSGRQEGVWVFLGDMAANTGSAFTCVRWAERRNLNLYFIVEDNGISVCTPTNDVWGNRSADLDQLSRARVSRYTYQSIYPHAGAGVRVEF